MSKKIRNTEYVNSLTQKIEELEQSELAQCAALIMKSKHEELSEDDRAEIMALAQAKLNRADRVVKYNEVDSNSMDKMKALGIDPIVLKELSNDSKSSKHVKHIFAALAQTDKALLANGHANVMDYAIALVNADDTSEITIAYIESQLSTNAVRHAKLFSSVYERLGMLSKNFDGKRLDSITINEKSKVWKRMEKMFA